MGCFGGEIRTPHLDSSPKPACAAPSSTRAPVVRPRAPCCSAARTRISRPGQHERDDGAQPTGVDGYEGYLNTAWRPATTAQGCRLHTYMRQMAHGEAARPNPRPRGFERDFSCSTRGQLLGHGEFSAPTLRNPPSPRMAANLKKLPRTTTPPRPTPTRSSATSRRTGRMQNRLRLRFAPAPHDPYHLRANGASGTWANTTRVGTRCAERLQRQIEMGLVPKARTGRTHVVFFARFTTLAPAQEPSVAKDGALRRHGGELDYHCGRLIDYLKRSANTTTRSSSCSGQRRGRNDLFKRLWARRHGHFLFASIAWAQTHPNAGAIRNPTSATARCGAGFE